MFNKRVVSNFWGSPRRGNTLFGAWVDCGDFSFPISGDPPEGGTTPFGRGWRLVCRGFQFLGIPPKGELFRVQVNVVTFGEFPISGDPPEGGTWYPNPPWADEL